MKSIVVYDTVTRNTTLIAEAIALALGNKTRVCRADTFTREDIKEVGLLVIGSPTYGGRPTDRITNMIDKILPVLPPGLKVATFDTRLKTQIAKLFGFAADRIAARFREKGADIIGAEGFIVKGRPGPLVEGEAQRASEWGRQIGKQMEGTRG